MGKDEGCAHAPGPYFPMFHLADFFTPFSAPLGTDLTVGRTSAWTGSSEGLGERGVREVARQIHGGLTEKGHRLGAILGFEVGRVELRLLQHADREIERKRGECPTGHARIEARRGRN
jgi:hypothetical protein